MRNKIVIGVIGILLCCGGLTQAANITFTSDANIQAGDTWSSVGIYDTPPAHTTVNMTGGLVDMVGTYNASTLNVHGGQVINTISMWNYSTVNIFDGLIEGASIHNYANINVYSGTFQGIHVEDFGVVTIRGGTMESISGLNYSVINLFGGSITDHINGGNSINVFGYDLAKTDTGGTYGYGQITGFWQDGSSFNIDIGGSGTYSRVNLIPEPATLLLLGAGTFLLRKSKRRIQKS
jgi:hypothetical protein